MLVRTARCIEGKVEIDLVCEPAFDYGRAPAEWSMSDDRHRADASGAGQTLRLQTDMLIGIEAGRARARHVLKAGRGRVLRARLGRGGARPEHDRGGVRAARGHDPVLARAGSARARIPDHGSVRSIQRSALTIKGLTYMPTGATVAALTTSLPETPGGERNWDYRYTWIRDSTFTLQALLYLNLDWEADEFMQFVADLERNEDGGAADHVRDRRPSRPHRVAHRRSRRLRRRSPGPDRQRRLRPAPERRVRRGARLDPAAHAAQPAPPAPAVAARQGPGRVRQGGVARTRPGHLGGARRAAALRLLQAHVLGGAWTARPSSPRSAASRRWPAEWAADRRRDQGRHPRARRRRAGGAPPALRHRRARRLEPAGRDLRLPARLRRAPARERAGDRRRADRGRVRAALPHRRDRRRAVRQGGDVPDLLVLARLGPGDHRRGAAGARPDGTAAPRRLAARPLRRGVRRRHRPAPRELPAGVLAPRADRGGRRESSSPSGWRSYG